MNINCFKTNYHSVEFKLVGGGTFFVGTMNLCQNFDRSIFEALKHEKIANKIIFDPSWRGHTSYLGSSFLFWP